MSQNVCCVPGCSVTRKDHVVLHRFPNPETNMEKFQTWLANIGGDINKLDTNVIVQNRRVCARHFEDMHKYPNNRLCKLAVPILNMPGNDNIKYEDHEIKDELHETVDFCIPETVEFSIPETVEFSIPETVEFRGKIDDNHEIVDEIPATVKFKVSKCGVCFSRDRKLSPLGELKDIFQKITSDIEIKPSQSALQNLDNIELCWECLAVLSRVRLLQGQLRKALEAMSLEQDDLVSLSSLTSVTLKEDHPHTLYIFEDIAHTDVDIHVTEVAGDNYEQDDNQFDHQYTKSEDDEIFVEAPIIESESNSHSKKSSQIKKQKFKIVIDNKNYCFNRVQIKYEDVLLKMKNERESLDFKSKTHKCFECVISFPDAQLLEEHVKEFHHKVTQYTCDLCNSNILTKRHLVSHLNRHFYKYACTLCDFSCYDKSLRQKHYKRHRRVLQCLKCKLKFGRKEFFKHYKEHHENFICDYCNITFKTRHSIETHIRRRHTKFECKQCKKCFSRYNGLWFHNRTTHRVKSSDAVYCVECDRHYQDTYRYKWHLNNSVRHNLKKKKNRISCPGCDKVFTKNIYMKDHYNLVHLKFYKYSCEACKKNFTRNADLIKHTRRVHEGILPPKNKICPLCGRGFSTNEILNHHMRTHTGERPYVCVTCGASFAQNAALRVHQRALHAPLSL